MLQLFPQGLSNQGVMVRYMKESLFIVNAFQEEIKEGKFPLALVSLTVWFSQDLASLGKKLGRAIESMIVEAWGRCKGCIDSAQQYSKSYSWY